MLILLYGTLILMVLLPLLILIKILHHSVIEHNYGDYSGNLETSLFMLLSSIEKYRKCFTKIFYTLPSDQYLSFVVYW